jgi:hypothetical protein
MSQKKLGKPNRKWQKQTKASKQNRMDREKVKKAQTAKV